MTAIRETALAAPSSPFRGLAPFGDSELDAFLFFGREREIEVINANLMASKLTVLYGPSGVGKTSVLRAGVAQRMRAIARENLRERGVPELAVAIVHSWSGDAIVAVDRAVVGAVADALGNEEADFASGSLVERLGTAADAVGGELYLVLDQIEEYFLYHGGEAGEETLADAFRELVVRSDSGVNVLVCIREDALAQLDAFKAKVPGLFANSLRLDRLDRRAARDAIVGPIDAYNRLAAADERVQLEPALVDAVLDQVTVGRIDHGKAGRGTARGSAERRRIEAPYLQLVLQRVWDAEFDAGSRELRLSTLEGLGGAERIVEQHLERALAALTPAQKDVAAGMFGYLVTPSGSKIAHDLADLAKYAGAGETELRPVADALVGERILRPVASPGRRNGGRVEIYHDVLAEAIAAWRRDHEAQATLGRERAEVRRRQRRLLVVAGAAVFGLTLMTAVAIFALTQRQDARKQARAAKSRELTVSALAQIDRDPELSMLLALEAARLEESPAVEEALRDAILRSRARRVIRLGSPVLAAALVGDEIIAVTADGRLHAPDVRLRNVGDVRLAAFAPDGKTVATSGSGGVRIWDVASGRSLGILRLPAPVVRLSADGDRVAAATADGALVVASTRGSLLARFQVPSRPTALTMRGSVVAVASGHVARTFSSNPAHRRLRIDDRATILGLAVSPDRQFLATAAADGGIRIWDIDTGRLRNVLIGHTDFVTSVVYAPGGDRIITTGADRTARVWDPETSRRFAILGGHSDSLTSVTTAEGGRLAVTGSLDGTVRIWDATGDPELRLLRRLTRTPSAVEWRPGGPRPVYVRRPNPRARLDGTVVRLGTGVVLQGHTAEVTSARFSPDGRLVVTASRDHDARIWATRSGRVLRVLDGHFGAVSDASFSSDGRWVVTAGPASAGLWRADSGRLIAYLRGHTQPLVSAIFSPNATVIATVGADQTLRTYRCEICGDLSHLASLARRRLDVTGRRLTLEERRRFLDSG